MLENAKWIWINEISSDLYADFSVPFTYEGGQVLINLSCDGDYTLFVNGAYSASGQYGDYEHYKVYDTVNITPLLKKGENEIIFTVWHFGTDTQRYKKYLPGLIFEFLLDGVSVISSDEAVLSRKNPCYQSGRFIRASSQLGYTFGYDARGIFNEEYQPSAVMNKSCTLFPRPTEKLCLGELICAKEIECADKSSRVFDLGREELGLLSFKLTARGGTHIEISYGESLSCGHVRKKIHDRSFYVDYICLDGENEYTNHMLRLCGRYLEVRGDCNIEISYIGLIPQYYPTSKAALPQLDCDEIKIYNSCIRTLELCMMEHYVDCPWREQCLYAFDSRNQMLSGYYAFEGGNFKYAESCLRLLAMSVRDDGLLSICSPCGNNLAIPSFSLYFILALREHYEHSKSKELVKELIPCARGIINAFVKNTKESLVCLLRGGNYWNFYDWSPLCDGYDDNDIECDAMLNAILCLGIDAYMLIFARQLIFLVNF